MSADEESFIVLDETPSMLQYSILDVSSFNTESIISKNSLYMTNNSSVAHSLEVDGKNKSIEASDLKSSVDTTSTVDDLARMTLNGNVRKSSTNSISSLQQPVLSETNGRQQSKATLAQSFLLGAIDCDTMKSNVKSYFPSLSSSTNTEDIEKLQSLIQERNELKDTLQKTNVTMRQQFSMVNNWHNNVKLLKDNHDQELRKFKNINDELFHQNHDLQDKVAELQKLAELSRKSFLQSEQNRNVADKSETERLARQVNELKTEMANVIASKVECEEIHQENVEKCAQLQVELVAIQTLYKNANEDAITLRTKNEDLKKDLKQSKDLIAKYRDEIGAIQAQCDVFRNDFELERKAREEMACERDQMIADIRLLKKRNQALVDEAQSYYTETSATSLTSLPTTSTNQEIETTQNYMCPICSIVYDKLNELESHVQSCLERSEQ